MSGINLRRYLWFTVYEYSVEQTGINVRLNYGYFNPDYPAIMKDEVFTIDIDAYSQSLIYKEDIEKFVDNMHFEVQDCFEKMITDRMREEMNNIE